MLIPSPDQRACRPIRSFLAVISAKFNVNCYLYEWPGFHYATGYPTEDTITEAAEAAFRHIAERNGNHIILMSHSIGSGPSIRLAARYSSHHLLRGVWIRTLIHHIL